jgi:hypothetical protein
MSCPERVMFWISSCWTENVGFLGLKHTKRKIARRRRKIVMRMVSGGARRKCWGGPQRKCWGELKMYKI